jgi:hypothetical protein
MTYTDCRTKGGSVHTKTKIKVTVLNILIINGLGDR